MYSLEFVSVCYFIEHFDDRISDCFFHVHCPFLFFILPHFQAMSIESNQNSVIAEIIPSSLLYFYFYDILFVVALKKVCDFHIQGLCDAFQLE